MKPGNLDTLHAAISFPSDNCYGIPLLVHTPMTQIPHALIPYRTRIQSHNPLPKTAVHFFLDDFRFEPVWNRPFGALPALQTYGTALTPDFSLYREWPLVLQLWNTYRNRWCGAFWQAQGLTVIPTVSWGDKDSFAFCFLGIPRRSLVAISTVGVKLEQPMAYSLFMAGFEEMLAQLQPTAVLCYGRIPAACQQQVEVVTYPTRWESYRRTQQFVRFRYGR